jgi:hypothetical protein
MAKAFIFVLCIVLVVCATVFGSVDRKQIGFGAQRLKNNHRNSLSATADCGSSVEYYFADAVVDNFAPINAQQKWAGKGQRYWINDEFFGGKGSPILVFIGGEGQETCTRLGPRMYAYNLAQEHNALMVNVEHRFYGESYPTEGMTTSELQYLSSSQALADLARVIEHVKSTKGLEDSKVVTIGGSYPGNLAGWFRLKYPSVSHASIASSAPVIAKTNFYEYMDVVADSIKYFSGQSCYNAFESAAKEIASLAAQGFGSAGMQQLEKDFNTCSTINTSQDLAVLYSDLMGNVQGTIQYNNEHLNVMNVNDICATMTADNTPYNNFVALSALYRTANGQSCEDASWADMTAYLAATAKDPTNAGRPWTYQTCNEFGYFQTADSTKQPFHAFKELNLDFSRQICAAIFDGWSSDPEVDWINIEYGNTHIEGTNIVFPSGTIDPWHALGVTNTTVLPQSTEESVYILGTAHCNDLYAPANSDPASLTQAREIIAAHVAKWLA